ncbi:MAG: ATP-binding cassette domain-containing protein [Opitutaceae bacterium]|nr:ATP-binding cassette domain-containing protein [Opitutaceae bacterium]
MKLPTTVPALEVKDVVCSYGTHIVLENISFTVSAGEIFFIVGGSGCGKSTLLKHLIGLRRPTAGSIAYFGESFTSADPGRRRLLQRSFGVLYQSAALWSSLTVAQNVELPLEEYTDLSVSERREVVALKLAQVGLTGYENHFPAEISGGMKKRAGLARALALDPKVVFFDEPSAGLDPITSRRLDELVCRIRDTLGTTLIIVSHELDSIFGTADRVIMLAKETKGIIAEGPPLELARTSDDPRVREFFHRSGPAADERTATAPSEP